MKIRVEWFDIVVMYESLDEVVIDLTAQFANSEDWASVERWGELMNSGKWGSMTVEEKAQRLRDDSDEYIEKLTLEGE